MKPDMDRLKTQALTVNTATQVQVLLVDDEPRMLSSLYELIKDEGYALHTATNGSEAIALLREGRYDLVILDWHLPDMDGHVVMDFMITLQTTTNVIVTSGARGIDAVIGALQRGAYDYLRKPYAREELLKTVNNALQQRRLTAENQLIARRLANSEKVYRYLVNSSPDIIYTLDNSLAWVQTRRIDRPALLGTGR
jgi:DNA-binding NtrC family response regulator